MTTLDAARRMMVDGQIRPNDVTDRRILGAFERVPRERFVPADQAAIAYLDRSVRVGQGRFLLQAMTLAKMLQAVDIAEGQKVLDVGCATGYSTAILAAMGADVFGLEEDEASAAVATRTLLDLGSAATVRRGPLAEGAQADGPFDVIVLNGSVEFEPKSLLAQLKEGGRLVCVERRGGLSRAMLYVMADGDAGARPLFDASAPVLPGFAAVPQFAL
ncbi:protein-L-isoaspartate O-methyltransferase [Variibacter gotjawalensis]|uniref:Protein-L-isoaspartate O-methyltransferase n=1 Tax=Variibacter gotjawalensis TaxID=1333996 RepID=A0A0S3PWP8_9BRAD|nr:protein-L-isoaspartate O-methyltransferase [Variibacter gotjawalensis]NIK46150.1 protein-L-isoaspartate(D-aspartate) O-methyltransferase [Variibacter gotjawalensis]RZS48068.1 protein-L-isoaspartate(D-aspartate) O-methyltransferase [Variibacter gotjawalensis]BAT60324.1 protein-L-isoaspartate O-methyltransferase [Variibacter gotjawalensis]